jgi:23S rRNA pseudouridine2605 synthase
MKVPAPYNDASHGQRLQKVMASAGVASRRDCEKLIEQGRVTVNGVTIAALPAWVDPATDHVVVNGTPLPRPKSQRPASAVPAGMTYIMLHKPRGVVSTTEDDLGRRTVLDLIDLKTHSKKLARLYPVGRLDADSTGLILLTNDGELTQRLTHPSFGITKQYVVSIKGQLTLDDAERLKKGLTLAHKPRTAGPKPGVKTKKAAVESVRILGQEVDRTRGDRTKLAITLTEGQNREIRRLLARLGHNVRRLKRVALGPLKLTGLAAGQWRFLLPAEVAQLRRAAGLLQRRRGAAGSH